MSVIGHIGGSASEVDVGDIGHSLRFRSSASTYLSRTPSSAGNRKTWTWSGWVKRGSLGSQQWLITCQNSTLTGGIAFESGDTLSITEGSGTSGQRISTAVFRDPSAHYHVVGVFDSSNATAEDRLRFYVNGVRITSFSSTTAVPLNADGSINTANAHNIGRRVNATGYFDGYLSRVCFVDGQALTPDSFGYFNTEINEWVSKSQSQVKAVVDAGGANSFMLDFDDGTSLTTLGYDKSSKGNNWTCNNISLTAGATYDWMLDVPGNSYAVLNPLNPYKLNASASYGNLRYTTPSSGGQDGQMTGSLAFSSGKYYFEVFAEVLPYSMGFGVHGVSDGLGGLAYSYTSSGQKGNYNTYSSYGSSFGANAVIGCYVDLDTKTIGFVKDGVDQGVAFSSIPNGAYTPAIGSGSHMTGVYLNHGQYPFISGSTYYADAKGWFRYPPPAGFKALCQANLPEGAIRNPKDHHHVVTITKSGDTNFTIPWDASVYDTYFEIKCISAAGDWYQIDGLRGYDKVIKSNSAAAEVTDANVLGVAGATGTLKSTLPSGVYVIAMWKAGLTASRQTNTDGSISSTVSRNVTSGFAIVTYTGTGVAATVGHGLGAVPATITVKPRGTANGWVVGHKDAGWSAYLQLHSSSSLITGTPFNNTAPTSAVFSLGASGYGINDNAVAQVAYVYAQIPGYSYFSSYTGNGVSDGPYVQQGFKAMWERVKGTNLTANWTAIDAARDPVNVVDGWLLANLTNAESTLPMYDITSNGIKARYAGGSDTNTSTGIYVTASFAQVAGKYSNAR